MGEIVKSNSEQDTNIGSERSILTEDKTVSAPETRETSPVQVDLKTPEYDSKFRQAEYYIKIANIKAEQITQEGLESGAYTDKGIRFDEESGEYVVDTYVMRKETAADGIVGRVARLEDTRPVTPGEWIATNPTQQENDYPNNYVIPDTLFQKRYEATNQEGVYRNKGGVRIIKNETGHSVIIEAPWGGPQEGDEHCYFCAACDDETETSISPDNRFILSENDFTTYVLASKAKD